MEWLFACSSECGGRAFAGPDAHGVLDRQHENLSVTTVASAVGFDDGFDQLRDASSARQDSSCVWDEHRAVVLERAMASGAPASAPLMTR